ncbi:MAG: hypothetical protein AMJ56_05180 [Anaerolineae bacterium SG8_19]|nr:MAG: hypothetical protein AMJ56_05180 [Anaerolineae bacterium SG8_19]
MTDQTISEPILTTKLCPPRIPDDVVWRERLLAQLDGGRELPLTLVSAGAGYGKSTLLSQWLARNDSPSAWLSLDGYDNDLSQFLSYFAAAVRTMIPDACSETLSLVKGTDLPPLPILARILINELDQIQDSFLLVLDDYHAIQHKDIHELLDELLTHPPRSLHLVIASRVDPPFNLTSYRARRTMHEIRAKDLRFNEFETAAFLERELGTGAGKKTKTAVLEQLEGWVTGLRLFTMSLRQQGVRDLEPFHEPGNISTITQYLMGEVLESQPAVIQKYLLHTSILDRFCAPLCEAFTPGPIAKELGNTDVTAGQRMTSEMEGERFLTWLKKENIFVVSLDEGGQWFRYHHLFQEILQGLLQKRMGAEAIAGLHQAASGWFAEHGLIEEALQHALAARDTAAAVELIAKQRHVLMNQELFHVLDHWLKQLPPEAVSASAQLLLAKGWLLDYQSRHEELPPLLEKTAALLEADETLPAKERSVLEGEIAVLRGILLYWIGQGQPSLDECRHAIAVTPPTHEWVRGTALSFHAAARQLVGQLEKAYEEIYQLLTFGSERDQAFTHRAYDALLGVEAMSGDLSRHEQAAQQQVAYTEPRKLFVSLGWARYSIGFVNYQRNELDAARLSFEQLIDMRYLTHAVAAAQGYYGLALTYQALGNSKKTREIGREAMAWAVESANPFLVLEAYSFGDRLALLQGKVPEPTQWASPLGDEIPVMMLLQAPHMTFAQVLLAEGTEAALQDAEELLMRLEQAAKATHNTWRTMEITAMQAILKEAQGERQEALDLLGQVLVWAQPYEYIRLFTDLGPRMADLLKILYSQGNEAAYSAQILAAFPGDFHSPDIGVELTRRELEVLGLMSQGLSNKEIAAQLYLSIGSVKQYTHRIYQKLAVPNRREAVRRATDLRILAAP